MIYHLSKRDTINLNESAEYLDADLNVKIPSLTSLREVYYDTERRNQLSTQIYNHIYFLRIQIVFKLKLSNHLRLNLFNIFIL